MKELACVCVHGRETREREIDRDGEIETERLDRKRETRWGMLKVGSPGNWGVENDSTSYLLA